MSYRNRKSKYDNIKTLNENRLLTEAPNCEHEGYCTASIGCGGENAFHGCVSGGNCVTETQGSFSDYTMCSSTGQPTGGDGSGEMATEKGEMGIQYDGGIIMTSIDGDVLTTKGWVPKSHVKKLKGTPPPPSIINPIKGKETLKEGCGCNGESKETSEHSYMAASQLHSISNKAEDMYNKLEKDEVLDDWVESHLAKIDQMMDSVSDSFNHDESKDMGDMGTGGCPPGHHWCAASNSCRSDNKPQTEPMTLMGTEVINLDETIKTKYGLLHLRQLNEQNQGSWWGDPNAVNPSSNMCVQSVNQPQSYFTGPYPNQSDCEADWVNATQGNTMTVPCYDCVNNTPTVVETIGPNSSWCQGNPNGPQCGTDCTQIDMSALGGTPSFPLVNDPNMACGSTTPTNGIGVNGRYVILNNCDCDPTTGVGCVNPSGAPNGATGGGWMAATICMTVDGGQVPQVGQRVNVPNSQGMSPGMVITQSNTHPYCTADSGMGVNPGDPGTIGNFYDWSTMGPCPTTSTTGCDQSAWSNYSNWVNNFENLGNFTSSNPNQPCQMLCQKETLWGDAISTGMINGQQMGPNWTNQIQCKLDVVQSLMNTHNCSSSNAPAC